jgi:hypothetical protein
MKAFHELPVRGEMVQCSNRAFREADLALHHDIARLCEEYGWVAVFEMVLGESEKVTGGRRYAAYLARSATDE